MQPVYFITGSDKKFAEIKVIVPQVEQLQIDLPELQALDPHTIITAKLEEAKKHHAGSFIVEDTSLYLDALNGLPGPFIKWFMETIGNEGLFKIAKAFNNFDARAKTIIGYADESGGVEFFEGEVHGVIVEPAGEGFGWDSIFKPEGYDKNFAQMGVEEKNKISMRKLAAEKLKNFLGK